MSRSTKYPMATNGSGKSDKFIANKKFRQKEKQSLLAGNEPPMRTREVSDVYSFVKDDKVDFLGTEYEAKARRK